MKVRLSESLIRIRVNLDDVSQWHLSGQVDLSIPWIHHHCKIELSFTEAEHWQIPDIGTHIWCIQVPKPVFLEWVNTQQESIEYRNGSLRISIEKDYPCEHRLGEETRNFTRPHETH